MTISYEIDRPNRLVRMVLNDYVSPDEWSDAMLKILRSPDYNPGFGVLVDRRDAPPSTTTFVRHVIGFMLSEEEMFRGSRWALVVRDPVGVEMAEEKKRLGAKASLAIPIQIFYNVAAAESWLKRTTPQT